MSQHRFKPKFRKRSPKATLKNQLSKSEDYLDRVKRAGSRLRLSPKRWARFLSLLGVDGCRRKIPLSDVIARMEGEKILYDVVKEFLPSLAPDGTRVFHVTFADDIGLTSDRTPNLKLAALKRKVDKAMRAMGVSGIVMVEVQPLTNFPAGGQGRTLMVNAHALCWGKVSRRKFRKAHQALNASRSWRNQFGAEPIVPRELKVGLAEPLRIAAYVAKMPHDAVYLAPVGHGKFRFRPTLVGYPDNLALRIAEGLSHYTIYDAVFSVGNGKTVRKHWKQRLEAWHKERLAAEKVHKFDVTKFWRRVHADARASFYSPFEIE